MTTFLFITTAICFVAWIFAEVQRHLCKACEDEEYWGDDDDDWDDDWDDDDEDDVDEPN